MRRKTLVLVVILLLFGVNVSGDIDTKKMSTTSFDGNILYVGGSGPNNYTKIQDAIDDASDGDTVFVYSGFYDDYFPDDYCCVKIHKSIRLIGEDKNTTIIDGGFNWDVIRLGGDAHGIEICGFTIQNSSRDELNPVHGIDQTHSDSSNNKIYDNIIKNNKIGISKAGSPYCEIYNNIIDDNYQGISINSDSVNIHNNIIKNSSLGIFTYGHSTIIQNNIIEDNEIGIRTHNSKIKVIENNFIDNDVHVNFYNIMVFINILQPFSYRCTYRSNYWGDKINLLPKALFGTWTYFFFASSNELGPFPTVQFDFLPASEPYDIEV